MRICSSVGTLWVLYHPPLLLLLLLLLLPLLRVVVLLLLLGLEVDEQEEGSGFEGFRWREGVVEVVSVEEGPSASSSRGGGGDWVG